MSKTASAIKTELYKLVDGLDNRAAAGAAVILRRLQAGEFDPDQAWFWTPEWLAGELEADQQIAEGKGEFFESDDAFISALRNRR